MFERQLFGVPFQYPFTIGQHSLNIAMHGDKYELRVDGNSFSHLYNQTKAKMMYHDHEGGDMGAYGVQLGKKQSYDPTYSNNKYDDYEDSPKRTHSKTVYNKNDPFNWDDSNQSSNKFENNKKAKKTYDEADDGWGETKKSHRDIPDPYSSGSKQKQPKSYFEDDFKSKQPKTFDFDSHDSRGKTMVNKKKEDDFFSSGFNKSSNKKEFDKSNQPKEFDFDNFDNKESKSKSKGNEFDDVFADSSKPKDDPFSWDNTNTKSKQNTEDFDFNFDSKDKKSNEKGDVADFLDSHTNENKDVIVDPFTSDNLFENKTPASTNDLSDIKFDYPVANQTPEAIVEEPVIEEENPPLENQPPVDESDPWAKKELFNLKNLAKATKKTIEIKSNDFSGNLGPFGSSNSQFNQPLPNTGFQSSFNAPVINNTQENRMSAIESVFGSSTIPAQPQPVQQTIPQSIPQTMPQPAPQTSGFGQAQNNDFGEFPSMFGSNETGFGNFEGFGNENFGSSNFNTQPAPQPQVTTAASSGQKKNDEWFDF